MPESFAVSAPQGALLQHLTATLAAAYTQSDVLTAALKPAVTALGADSGTILLADAHTASLQVRAAQGHARQTPWQPAPYRPGTPLGDVVALRRALYFDTAGALEAAYPDAAQHRGGDVPAATALVPLLLGERVLGVLILECHTLHLFSAEERHFLSALAAHTALALDRSELFGRLQAGEGLFRRMVDISPIAMGVGPLDGRLSRANDAWLRLTGHSRAAFEAGQIDWPAMTPPEYHDKEQRFFERAFVQGSAISYHKELLTTEGERVPVEMTVAPFDDTQVMSYALDLRPFRRQEQALRSESARLEQLVAERTAALEAERTALQTFVTFTEDANQTQDLTELGRLVLETLRALIPDITAIFYEREGHVWQPRSWTGDLDPELLTVLQRGLPLDVPISARMLETQRPVFVDGWTEAEQGVAHSQQFHTAAICPVFQEGEIRAILTVGLRTATRWTAAQRSIIRALGRSFSLLYDRISAARQVQRQRDEAERRSQALEAFAVLARDLAGETNRHVLVRRAQEIMLSLLTPGYALYWEAGEDRWHLKSQVGDIGDPALQRFVDEHGLPLDAPALHSTWQTGLPNYQDNYAQGADTPAEMIRHVQAATAFRVQMHGQPVGMLAIGLFDQRTWTPMDRAVLETAIYSLGLVLERAQSIEALARSNAELQSSNAELEAFTYSASHDLRTPVRHVKGFAEMALKAHGRQQGNKVVQYLGIVSGAADRMTAMIDAMLILSRAGRVELQLRPVSLQSLVEQAQRDVHLEFPEQRVEWHIGALPTVQADAATLQQVLTNLLSNAVKFALAERPLQIRIWAEERPQAWAVFVQDNGAGFDARYADKLFGAFQRLHTQQQFAGTGVGLATVRRIVLRHGGQVWASGQVNEGATFGFSLPR
ncbi:GAF domain-containing protein [Deinococcus petrolearius]|uniref:histidine kinase n=1 Tax=Deinococcus petrolearius TaxID=1751295 RepID=A0ABW1DGN1_9DEIO